MGEPSASTPSTIIIARAPDETAVRHPPISSIEREKRCGRRRPTAARSIDQGLSRSSGRNKCSTPSKKMDATLRVMHHTTGLATQSAGTALRHEIGRIREAAVWRSHLASTLSNRGYDERHRSSESDGDGIGREEEGGGEEEARQKEGREEEEEPAPNRTIGCPIIRPACGGTARRASSFVTHPHQIEPPGRRVRPALGAILRRQRAPDIGDRPAPTPDQRERADHRAHLIVQE